ncbi:DUF2157 domain-containing protein [Ferruginibacter lapsinanis]|uniref:DUF2157 domain-containing protein n=1 Tax=Ferruginibacter lapsinanis TaxID=563172 RepID=UPI001E5DCB3A|nr:DUF2157 domain-containing protein [Ferruginibacter lapsinanis]UEG49840.1 DUF2157 domain-containing protein [Ferruginibacter lapsinanis]
MNKHFFTQWHAEGLLSDASIQKINEKKSPGLLSVYWEIKTLMYLAVILLSSGLGILVYKNLDSIGHTAILTFLILLCVGCFYYCIKHAPPFSTRKTASPNAVFDYLLLLGCLSFITTIAYIQYQYNFFGNRFGIASFIPMTILFLSAYYFDNIGILSLAITNLAAWLGITVTPLEILKANDFNDNTITLTALLLSALLIAAAFFSKQKDIKQHFEFTYSNFGMHIFFIACIAAMFNFSNIYLIWFLVLLGVAYYFYTKSLAEKSFYILLVTTLYTYFAISYVVVDLLTSIELSGLFSVYMGLIYLIGSAVGMILFLINTNKKIKVK